MRGALVSMFFLLSCGGSIETTPTGTTTPGPSPGTTPKQLTAYAYEGGLGHLMIYAADPGAGSCIVIHLTYPETAKNLSGITTPAKWGVTNAFRSVGSKECAPGVDPPTAESALDAEGSIDFTTSEDGALPCALSSVKVNLMFRRIPQTEIVDGANVTVQGCQ